MQREAARSIDRSTCGVSEEVETPEELLTAMIAKKAKSVEKLIKI